MSINNISEVKNTLIDKDFSNLQQIVTFEVGKEAFGFDISLVQEIITPIKITVVPNSKKFIIGVINLRGKIIPIFDLKHRIKGRPVNIDADSKIIVVLKNDTSIGLLVSKVNEVVLVENDKLKAPSEKLNNLNDDYISSIANLDDRLISILDLDKAIFEEE